MLELKIDNKTYECEGSWNEFTRKRLVGLMRVLAKPGMEGPRLLRMSSFMLKLRGKKFEWFRKLQPAWIHHICTDVQCLGWIREQGHVLSAYVLRGFWHRGMYYCGPPKRILRISSAELIQSRMAFETYCKIKEHRFLEEMVATLYRPINPLWWLKIWDTEWTGDRRLPLNDWTMKRRTRRFAKLDVGVKLAVLKQYTGALQLFEAQYPLVFTKAEQSGEVQDKRSWVNLLFAMSGGIFGTLRETEKTDCSELFIKLEMDIKENLRLKDLSRKNK